MATLTPLVPNSDIDVAQTAFQWTDSAGTTAWDAINEDPASPNTADYCENDLTETTTFCVLGLTAVDADFGDMATLRCHMNVSPQGTRSDDNVLIEIQITAAGGGADYVAKTTIATWDGGGSDSGELDIALTLTGTGDAADKAAWDDAEVIIHWTYSKTKGGDNMQYRCVELEFTGTYNLAPAGQPTPIRTRGVPTGSGSRDRIGGFN